MECHGVMRNHSTQILNLGNKGLSTNQVEEESSKKETKNHLSWLQHQETHKEEHPACHEADHIKIIQTKIDIFPFLYPNIHRRGEACKEADKEHHYILIHFTLALHLNFLLNSEMPRRSRVQMWYQQVV